MPRAKTPPPIVLFRGRRRRARKLNGRPLSLERMTIDPDAYKAASLLLSRYGEDALARAARRVEELLDADDEDGAAIWYQIHEATEELLRTTPLPDEAVH